MLEHTVLVDARLVGEGIGPHHRLVGLHRVAGDLAHQLGRGHDLPRVDAGVTAEHVRPHLDRHHDLLERGIARALAEPVDGALDLPRTGLHRRQRIGDRHAKVVVAVRRPNDGVGAFDAFDQLTDALAPQIGDAVPHRIRHIKRLGAGLDRRLEHAAEEVHVRANRVFRRKLNVVGELAGELDCGDGRLDHLVGLHAQLLLHVDGRSGDKGVDPLARRRGDGVPGGLDIALGRACKRADGGVLNHLCDRADRLGVAWAGGGKAGFDDVNTQLLQLAGNPHFFVAGHRRARALLAVAECGVKNEQTVSHSRVSHQWARQAHPSSVCCRTTGGRRKILLELGVRGCRRASAVAPTASGSPTAHRH